MFLAATRPDSVVAHRAACRSRRRHHLSSANDSASKPTSSRTRRHSLSNTEKQIKHKIAIDEPDNIRPEQPPCAGPVELPTAASIPLELHMADGETSQTPTDTPRAENDPIQAPVLTKDSLKRRSSGRRTIAFELKFEQAKLDPTLPTLKMSDRVLRTFADASRELPLATVDNRGIRHGRLLILDLDQTLLDYSGLRVGDTPPPDALRPHCSAFLKSAARQFDIAMWSMSTEECVRAKLKHLNMERHGIYPVFALSRQYSIRCSFASKHGDYNGVYHAKPVDYVLRLCPMYTTENILFVDDNPLAMTLSMDHALLVRPWFRAAHSRRPLYGFEPSTGKGETDLLELAYYLHLIRGEPAIQRAAGHSWRADLRRNPRENPLAGHTS